jgi:hypothetical protein
MGIPDGDDAAGPGVPVGLTPGVPGRASSGLTWKRPNPSVEAMRASQPVRNAWPPLLVELDRRKQWTDNGVLAGCGRRLNVQKGLPVQDKAARGGKSPVVGLAAIAVDDR